MRRVSADIRETGSYVVHLKTLALRKRQEADLEEADMKKLRFFMEVAIMDRILNEYIRGTAHIKR